VAFFFGRFFIREENQALTSSTELFNSVLTSDRTSQRIHSRLVMKTVSSASARTVENTQLLSKSSRNHGNRGLTSLVIMATRVWLIDSFLQHADRGVIEGRQSKRPDWPSGPSTLLFNGYWDYLPGAQEAEPCNWPLTTTEWSSPLAPVPSRRAQGQFIYYLYLYLIDMYHV
jgi:hypothetical protein